MDLYWLVQGKYYTRPFDLLFYRVLGDHWFAAFYPVRLFGIFTGCVRHAKNIAFCFAAFIRDPDHYLFSDFSLLFRATILVKRMVDIVDHAVNHYLEYGFQSLAAACKPAVPQQP